MRETRHGPVISDLDHPDGPILAVAMGNLAAGRHRRLRAAGAEPGRTVQRAGTAATAISSPVQNLLVADAKTIGLFVTGRVPIRKAGDGSAPVPGDGSHDWIGWASGEQLPHVVSPESGRLVNANEPVAQPDFPVFMGRDASVTGGRTGSGSCSAVDRQTLGGLRGDAGRISSIRSPNRCCRFCGGSGIAGTAEQALGLLRGWDGSAAMELPQPLIFNAWMEAFYNAVLHHVGLTAGVGAAPVSDFVASVLSPAGAHWCDGDCGTMLRGFVGRSRARP